MEEKGKSEEIKIALEEIRYIEGLLIGLFLGILGNLCVSFLIETIHAYGTTLFNTWLVVFVLSLVITTLVSLLLVRRIVMRILGIITTIFPSLKPKRKK
jgi:fructose-specific phosphotransferase system IIC component